MCSWELPTPRRERWAVGRQEDWRYADMRRRFGRNWSWISFFAGYIAQHPMLVGLTLPLYPAFGLDLQDPLPPFSVMDWAAFVVCAAGISVGFVADNQLFAYMKANATRSSDEKLKVLDSGLWALSRHPNHLGEQLFWVGLLLVALGQGATWCAFGVLYNHSIDTFVTLHLIEGRMLSQNDRAAEYRRYMERTPILVPWLLISPMGSGSSRQQRQKAR